MAEQNDSFSPQRVDEAIEQLSLAGLSEDMFSDQERANPDARLVEDLQKVYDLESRIYRQALQRVEDRLVAQRFARDGQQSALAPVLPEQRPPTLQRQRRQQGSLHSMENKQSSVSKLGRRLSLLVAVVVMVVLVGSMALVLTFTHRSTITGSGSLATSTPVPTRAPRSTSTVAPGSSFGKTLYTTPSNQFGFNGLDWSPDSRRVASSTINSVQIWDATTGQHLVNIAVTPYGLAWSPDSQMVAIAGPDALTIVNGQTGAIVHTYTVATARVSTSTSGPFLSTQISTSGGLGFRAVAWSHDGHFIAAAVSAGTSGYIQVLDAQTFNVLYTLQTTGNYNLQALAWSSDGQYLAASVFNTEPGNQTVPANQMEMIWAWKISTRQVVFQQSGGNGVGNPLAFQPGNDNLAFLAMDTSLHVSFQVWNVATDQLVKDYHKSGPGTLAWSPDGRYIAYAEQSANNVGVGILDANSGQEIYTYTGDQLSVCQLAWSPNGHYIASGEGQTQGDMVAKVWTAE